MRMLLVNDNRNDATTQAMILSGKGFTVETSFAVKDALSRLRSASFDVIVVNAGKSMNGSQLELTSLHNTDRQLCLVWITKEGIVIQGDGHKLLSHIGKKDLHSVFAHV